MDVSRLRPYYPFESKTRLLEALYNYTTRRGRIRDLAEVFGKMGDRRRNGQRDIVEESCRRHRPLTKSHAATHT